MEKNELYQILEAVVLRDSLSLYMNKLSEHRAHPNFEATMRFVGSLFKKYSRLASQKVEQDDFGNYRIRRNLRSDFDLN